MHSFSFLFFLSFFSGKSEQFQLQNYNPLFDYVCILHFYMKIFALKFRENEKKKAKRPTMDSVHLHYMHALWKKKRKKTTSFSLRRVKWYWHWIDSYYINFLFLFLFGKFDFYVPFYSLSFFHSLLLCAFIDSLCDVLKHGRRSCDRTIHAVIYRYISLWHCFCVCKKSTLEWLDEEKVWILFKSDFIARRINISWVFDWWHNRNVWRAEQTKALNVLGGMCWIVKLLTSISIVPLKL